MYISEEASNKIFCCVYVECIFFCVNFFLLMFMLFITFGFVFHCWFAYHLSKHGVSCIETRKPCFHYCACVSHCCVFCTNFFRANLTLWKNNSFMQILLYFLLAFWTFVHISFVQISSCLYSCSWLRRLYLFEKGLIISSVQFIFKPFYLHFRGVKRSNCQSNSATIVSPPRSEDPT